jgi:hypothetical protein
MAILGFSAGATGHEGNTDRMVRAVLERSGRQSEFVKLTDLNYTACKGCVELCAGPQVCQLEDDLLPYYPRVKEAEAVVLGSPVRHRGVSPTMLSFIDRFWGYRHVSIAIQNKPFILVLSHLYEVEDAIAGFKEALRSYRVNVVDVVTYCTESPPCYTCGRHNECRIGGLYRLRGEEGRSLKVTPELFCHWEDHPETVARVEAASERLQNL